jgi:hypothetical protein
VTPSWFAMQRDTASAMRSVPSAWSSLTVAMTWAPQDPDHERGRRGVIPSRSSTHELVIGGSWPSVPRSGVLPERQGYRVTA